MKLIYTSCTLNAHKPKVILYNSLSACLLSVTCRTKSGVEFSLPNHVWFKKFLKFGVFWISSFWTGVFTLFQRKASLFLFLYLSFCCVKVKQAYVLSFHIILQQSKRHPVLGYEAKKEEFPPWVSEASSAEAAGYMKEE